MIFALIGEEAFLIRRSLDKLLQDRLPATSRDFNFDNFEGRDIAALKVIESANTLPVNASRRVILIRNAQEMKKAEIDQLEPFLASVPETTDMILTAGKADQRLKFWQQVKKVAKVREFKPLYPNEAPAWIREEALSSGYRISSEAAAWIVSAVGSDLSVLHSTLEKLYLLKGSHKEISLKDVEGSITAFSWKSLFDLTDAVGVRNLASALVLFKRMLSAGESPIALVALLARHFRILLKVKEGSVAGIAPFFLRDYQRQAGQFRPDQLAGHMERIFKADWALKTSVLTPSLVFERLLIELCRA